MSIEHLLSQARHQAPSGHVLWDDMAVEVETALLLYALVRHQKPRLVVEDGTGQGVATAFIAEAVAANDNEGRVVTFEWHEEFADRARQQLADLPVTVELGTSIGTSLKPDVVFVDCVSDKRVESITYWLTHPDRPLVIVHDARRPYPFHLGDGVHLPGHDGVWVGRAKETDADPHR